MRLRRLALAGRRGQHSFQALSLLSRMRVRSPETPFAPFVRQFGERIARRRDAPLPAGWDETNQFEAK